jgi:selenide,water dikinase
MAPEDLEKVLAGVSDQAEFDQLLVGSGTRDDAAVYDIENGNVLISTTDFFTPVVDDPEDFGAIAAVNAINDVYAMGGKPIMALAILGWPLEKLGAEMASQVLSGARSICAEIGIPLAGGHSIDLSEPVFGLCVSGLAQKDRFKTNNGAKPGAHIYLTKPLGTGIVAAAQKRQKADPEHISFVTDLMKKSNAIGSLMSENEGVLAMTDVTGFGLLGHLLEMCRASKVSARISYDDVPLLPEGMLDDYLAQFIIPDNTFRNFKAYSAEVSELTGNQMQILCDPQTSGGLLVAVADEFRLEFESRYSVGSRVWHIGEFEENAGILVEVV